MKFTKEQLIVDNKDGIIYSVYGANPKNKTYHIKSVFVPKVSAWNGVKVGDKFNLSSRKESNYSAITQPKEA